VTADRARPALAPRRNQGVDAGLARARAVRGMAPAPGQAPGGALHTPFTGTTMILRTRSSLLLLVAGLLLPACSSGGGISATAPAPVAIDPTPFPDAKVGEPYAHVSHAVGGTPPCLFTVAKGDVPPGLTVTPLGEWAGTPTTPGLYTMTLTVADSGDPKRTGARDVALFVAAENGPLEIWTASLSAATMGRPYVGRVLVSGGAEPYRFGLQCGLLPPGLTLSAETGEISGTPTATGLFPVTIEVEDAGNDFATACRTFQFPVQSDQALVASHHPSLAVSRSVGVAPLSVFFDASGYTVNGVNRPFHHLHFSWDFDDPQSLHPVSTGGVAAHVFERPGTYAVRLTIQAPDGTTNCVVQMIEARDPDVEFAGGNTICFSNDGTFTGAPGGATCVTTNSFDTALTYLGNGKRLLFRRGDSFTSTNPSRITTTSAVSIGAFGAGQSPDCRGICTNNPRIVSRTTVSACPIAATDLRIADLRFVEASGVQTASAIGTEHRSTEVLVLRVAASGYEVPLVFHHDIIEYYHCTPHEAITVADCHVRDTRNVSVYAGGRRFAVIGNRFERSLVTHLVRIHYADQCTIDENEIEYPGSTRHAIKLHAQQTRSLYGEYSELIVIRANEIRARTPWVVAIGSQDPISDEWVRDVVVEKNAVIAENGVQAALYISGQGTTVRNNLFIGENNLFYDPTAVMIAKRGVSPTPREIEVYNNTYYNATPGNTVESLVTVLQHSGLVIVANNVMHAPTSNAMIVYPGGAGMTFLQANFVNQPFAFVDPINRNFAPGAGSVALGSAVATPARDDFLGMPRLFADAGAFAR